MKILKINIKEELIADIRDFKAPDLAKTILKNNQVADLISLAFEKNHLLSSRAMWVMAHCSDLDYNCIKPYHVKLINRLKNKGLHNGVIRNTLRLFQKHSVPTKSKAFILDKCFEYVKNPIEAIAVRAFAITVIFNIAKPYPELLNELLIVLNYMSETEEGPGIRSRVKNTLKDIHKLKLKIQ